MGLVRIILYATKAPGHEVYNKINSLIFISLWFLVILSLRCIFNNLQISDRTQFSKYISDNFNL